MAQQDQIRDLSKTITSGATNMPQGSKPGPSTCRPSADENLEIAVKRIVDQSLNSQMGDLKKIISDLTATVSKLSIVVHQTQQDHRKIIESGLPTTSKAANDSDHPMETSGMSAGSHHSSRCSSVHQVRYSRAENRPPVDKWGLEFEGDQNKLAVEDFIFRIERLQSQYGVPWKEVLDNFHLLVKGPAEKWYWLFIQTSYVTEWSTLKQALLKQYQSARSSFELMRDMVERRQ